jgi:uncharacterized protein YjiS (DUF1127 family)
MYNVKYIRLSNLSSLGILLAAACAAYQRRFIMTSSEPPESTRLPASLSASASTSFISLFRFALGRALRFCAHVGRVWWRRRDVARLGSLDARMLKDIGLTRNDVIGALEEPWNRDPSTVLMMRALERRVTSRTRIARGIAISRVTGETTTDDDAHGDKRAIDQVIASH